MFNKVIQGIFENYILAASDLIHVGSLLGLKRKWVGLMGLMYIQGEIAERAGKDPRTHQFLTEEEIKALDKIMARIENEYEDWAKE